MRERSFVTYGFASMVWSFGRARVFEPTSRSMMFLWGSRRAGACLSGDDPHAPLYIYLFSSRRLANIAPWLSRLSLVLERCLLVPV